MTSLDLKTQRVIPRHPHCYLGPLPLRTRHSPSILPEMQGDMDDDTTTRHSGQMSTSRRRVHFPKGHGKTLAQLYDWFMALLKQHPLLEPVIKEGRRWPYLMVNPKADAYAMLVKEGFLGLTMIPADPNARKQMVIIHGVSTAINVGLLDTPEAFLWLKRRVVAGEPRPQLLGLIEGPVPSSVYLHGLGHFRVGLYTPEPDMCSHCCRFGHLSWKCKSAPRCRYCSRGHPSSRCLEKICAGTKVLPLCCNCGGDHNATSRCCRTRPRPVREPQTTSTAIGPSRVVFRCDPPPQHNVWTNGPSSWSAFTAQPSAFPPQPGTAAPAQPGVVQPPVPFTVPPAPVPPRDASASALVDGAHQPAAAAAAPAPQADLDFEYICQILIEIKDKVNDIDLKLAALVQDMANPAPVVRSGRDAARG